MNGEGYFTVTSDEQHPANFTSNFTTPVSLGENYEIGLKSISHGPVFNVTNGNNQITLIRTIDAVSKTEHVDHVYIDVGFYYHKSQLFGEIQRKLKLFFEKPGNKATWGRESSRYLLENEGKITIKMPNPSNSTIMFLVDDKAFKGRNPLSYLLHMPDNRYKKITDFNEIIPTKNYLGFLYSSIIALSFINNQKSRLLAIVPLESNHGYSYFEFANITYYPLSVSTFTDIFFSLKDTHGERVDLGFEASSKYPTILKLHVRKRRAINRD